MPFSFTDLREWSDVLRNAALMTPDPATRPGADEKAINAYVAKVAAMLFAADWLANRFHRQVFDHITALLPAMRAAMATEAADSAMIPAMSPVIAALEALGSVWGAGRGKEMLVPPWVLDSALEGALLLGAATVLSRFFDPKPSFRALIGVVLAALAAGALYNLLAGWLLIKLAGAGGPIPELRRLAEADGFESPPMLEAAARVRNLCLWLMPVAIMPVFALFVCLARGFHAFGASRRAAWTAGAAAVLAGPVVAGTLATSLGLRQFLYGLARA